MTPTPSPTLLCTKTGDPFQPLRLYYALRDATALTRVLDGLRCIEHDREAGHWTWRYVHEAASLVFPQARHPLPSGETIVLGRFTLDDGRLVFSTRSVQRGAHALTFFGPRFTQAAVVARFRLINRWFDASEAAGGLERLDAMLDEGVTFIDSPEEKEKRSRQRGPAAGTDIEQMVAMDVPPIEDAPVHLQDETPDFQNLRLALALRAIRADERWNGNADATIGSIILEATAAAGSS